MPSFVWFATAAAAYSEKKHFCILFIALLYKRLFPHSPMLVCSWFCWCSVQCGIFHSPMAFVISWNGMFSYELRLVLESPVTSWESFASLLSSLVYIQSPGNWKIYVTLNLSSDMGSIVILGECMRCDISRDSSRQQRCGVSVWAKEKYCFSFKCARLCPNDEWRWICICEQSEIKTFKSVYFCRSSCITGWCILNNSFRGSLSHTHTHTHKQAKKIPLDYSVKALLCGYFFICSSSSSSFSNLSIRPLTHTRTHQFAF